MLDKHSPIPLYYQLAEGIRDKIRSGELRPGEQLPPERELSLQHGISRMTVRQALQYLIREDVLLARQGLGTFVAETKLSYNPLHVLGFTEDMMARGADVSSRVVEHARVVPPANVAAKLRLDAGEQAIKIIRLRLAGGVPLLLETVFVPAERFPGIEHADMAHASLYRLMREESGVEPAGALHTLEAVQATEFECAMFGVQPLAAMILLQGVTVDLHDQPIECFKAVYRGDRFEITLDSRGARTTEQNASRMGIMMRG
jgi:GntR family transcriptional regulator